MAAEEEPRPRPCGMRLAQTISRPRGWPPSRSNAVRSERTSRWLSSRGSVSPPSPAMSMCSPESATRTTTSSYRPSERPRASKPGPRLALVAGTRTLTAAARNAGPAIGRTTPCKAAGMQCGGSAAVSAGGGAMQGAHRDGQGIRWPAPCSPTTAAVPQRAVGRVSGGWGTAYRRKVLSRHRAHRRRTMRVARLLCALRPGKRVVELGCRG